ncbi:hypothetical protein [Martelella limonii]|uniref:hypothetical protein n=1 Tax=Martelella limonii TaxID=1647649 RepID=UPI00157FC977|nr:hypothetical protein [Martelella limonii]
MARPKLGDSETTRLHIKITEDEVEAIDTWRFDNRIPSRSEAVRRLCQIGILADNELDGIVDYADEIHHGIERVYFDTVRSVDEVREKIVNLTGDELKALDSLFREILRDLTDASDASEELYTMILGVFNGIAPFAESKTIQEGTTKSKEAISNTNSRLNEIQKSREQAEENRRLVTVWSRMTPEEVAEYHAMNDADQDKFLEQRIEALKQSEEELERLHLSKEEKEK